MSDAPFTLPGEAEAQVFQFTKFGTLNTKATRLAIADEEFAWNENWMPIGDGNLRTIYAEGAAIYTAPIGRTIINFVPFTLATASYAAVFLDNGTAVQVNLGTGATITINSTVGLFYEGAGFVIPTATQWQAKYLIIITTTAATSSYFIWDGSILFQAGTLSPDVSITSAGLGYTSPPTVTAFGGSGSGASFAAVVANGSVTQVTTVGPGSGYLPTDGPVQLVFSGGGSDTTATATASVSASGGVSGVAITNSGGNYTTAANLTFSGGGGSGAQAVITGLVSGAITQVTVTNPGTGYTSAPTIAANIGGGFTASVDVRYGQISGVSVVGGGTGYIENPEIIIGPPDSLSLPVLQATAIATVSGGAVTAITVTQPGLGYIKTPTVTIVGGNNAASGTVTPMPFGITGSTIETYSNSIWTANGNKISFTAPGTISQFSASAGGGSFQSNDSFLRTTFQCLKQTNGFLYLIGDSSINVISNVQTTVSGSVVTTTFNNSNVDPQTGTPWRDSVTVFGRAIVFANPTGIYALYGGAAEKVSGPLDGLFANANFPTANVWSPSNTGGIVPDAAVGTLFGIRCFMLAFTSINPYTNAQETFQAIWDGSKWFIGDQVNTMLNIGTSEFNSTLTTYGSTASSLYPLFQTPSSALTKTFQSKLRSDPSTLTTKQLNNIYMTAVTPIGAAALVNIFNDTEKGPGAQTVQVTGGIVFTGAGPITFVGTGPISWTSIGISVIGFDAFGVYGTYLGVTVSTNAPDMIILELDLLYRAFSPRP